MALMGAKGNNIAARGAGQPIAIMDDVGRQIDEINPVETPGALRDARANARQVQGVDPLATSNREFQGSEASGAFPDQPVKRTMTGPAGRLPHESDEVPGIREAENLAEDATNGGRQFDQRSFEADRLAQEGGPTFQSEMDFWFSEYEKLVGSPPPSGMPDEQVRKIVESINGPTKSATEIDIPF